MGDWRGLHDSDYRRGFGRLGAACDAFPWPNELTPADSESLAKFVVDWFDRSATADPTAWVHAKEWRADVTHGNVVEASCELISPAVLPLLAAAIESEFPAINEIRIGRPLEGPPDPDKLDWMRVDSGQVEIDGKLRKVVAFSISLWPVTVVQYEQFLKATGYRPVPDIMEHDGYLLENTRGQLGGSPKNPIFSLTYDDSCAYCDWAKLRLPSEEELAHFFRTFVLQQKQVEWAFPCWSSTSKGEDQFVAVHGPCVTATIDAPHEKHRLILHRHHYGWPEPACMRVVKPD